MDVGAGYFVRSVVGWLFGSVQVMLAHRGVMESQGKSAPLNP